MTDIVRALFTGFVQVFLVALQTRQVARNASLFWIFIVGIGISAVWVFNVRAAVSTLPVGVAYVFGAGMGTIAAMKVRLKEKKTHLKELE